MEGAVGVGAATETLFPQLGQNATPSWISFPQLLHTFALGAGAGAGAGVPQTAGTDPAPVRTVCHPAHAGCGAGGVL